MNETEIPTGTSLIDLLDQLVVPDPPPPVSMMPQTVGWAVVGALLAAMAVLVLWRMISRYRVNAYRRAALAELAQAADDPAQVAEILRRTALVAYDRRLVAGLQGMDWIAFLERTEGASWNDALRPLLLDAPYRGNTRASPDLTARVARWIKAHKREVAS